MKKEDINICYMINELYLDLTYKSMDYIRKQFRRSEEYNLRFWIIGIEQFDVEGDDVTFVMTSHPELPILHQRVYIPEILGVDKVIFIDSDTITLTCISKLWNIDLEGHPMGAVQHCQARTFGLVKMYWEDMDISPFKDIPDDTKYFNCGVMVFDCKKWIEQKMPEQILENFKFYAHTVHHKYDEPGFNVTLHDKWKEFDIKWNFLPLKADRPAVCHILHYYGEYPAGTPRHKMF